jgi:tetratricopeptide (TPR) repeat protein
LAYLALGNNNDAIAYLLKAIELEDDNSDYWFHLGECYEATEAIPEAVKCYKHTLSLDPKDAQAWYNLSKIFFIQQDYLTAIETISEAFIINVEDPELLTLEAACYFRLSGWTYGLTCLRKAVLIDEKQSEDFFKLYPEGLKNKKILKLLKNPNK